MEIWYLLVTEKFFFNPFGNGKYGLYLSQKGDGNMIFTGYWKVLVLAFSEMGNTVFSWAKEFTEKWYFLITGKFLFWTFRWWKIRSFFQQKSWWKDDIYVVFLSFLWYSRTWKIWFFAQCKVTYLKSEFINLQNTFQGRQNFVDFLSKIILAACVSWRCFQHIVYVNSKYFQHVFKVEEDNFKIVFHTDFV